jgi:imidazolonepropionase-like amidohydrolase
MTLIHALRSLATVALISAAARADTLVVHAGTLHPVAGPVVHEAVVIVRDGKIAAIGPAASTTIPTGARVIEAAVVTPGLIDAHSVVGLSGILNQPHDQDQVDRSAAAQPELRALDAYNAREPYVAYTRSFGVTTINTGHAPAALISGSTILVKLHGRSVDQDLIQADRLITVTIGGDGLSDNKEKAPGTRPKAVAMLRADLVKAQEYAAKRTLADESKRPARDLRLESLLRALDGTQPMLVTAQRAVDILAALRVAQEFTLPIILDGAAEAYLVLDEIKASGFPVVVHPAQVRTALEMENASVETPAKLHAAGIPFALQSGYETYAPKSRILLFEAAVAAGRGGLPPDAALAAITLEAAKILGIAERVGSLEVGKDADLALYDGDPFEYTSRCLGTIIDGILYPGESDKI